MVEMVETIINGKYKIILPKHRADRPEWYEESGWEKVRLQKMHDVIVADDFTGPDKWPRHCVVYYIGSEEGEMAALCQMWGADVVLIEPNARVWPNTLAIWQANKLVKPLLTVHAFAANKDSHTANVYSREFPEAAKGEVIPNHDFEELSNPKDIPQVKIDTLVINSSFPPSIITLDVEGSEFEVLRGAEDTLRKWSPDIFLSLHPQPLLDIYGENANELRNWLKNLGYKEEFLEHKHEMHLMYTYPRL